NRSQTMKINGLDDLQRQLKEAQTALAGIDGELGTVSFDPEDPASIESAIQQVTRLVDERLGVYSSNPIVGPPIGEMKERYRAGIVERAAAPRLGTSPDYESRDRPLRADQSRCSGLTGLAASIVRAAA